jgi:HEAT repeat protein
MKKRIWILLGLTLGFALLGVSLVRVKAPTKTFEGKPVGRWVAAFIEKSDRTLDVRPEAEFLKVQQIGSNAVPYLIAAIKHKPGFLSSKLYRAVYTNSPAIIAKRMPAPIDAQLMRCRAYSALGGLHSSARSAVPFLAEQFNTNNSLLDFVRAALSELGPDASEAIPVLTNALHGASLELRWNAARILANVEPSNPEIIPAMLVWLKGSDVISRRYACIVLEELGPAATSTLPALTEALQDEDKPVRANAAAALKKIRPKPAAESRRAEE